MPGNTVLTSQRSVTSVTSQGRRDDPPGHTLRSGALPLEMEIRAGFPEGPCLRGERGSRDLLEVMMLLIRRFWLLKYVSKIVAQSPSQKRWLCWRRPEERGVVSRGREPWSPHGGPGGRTDGGGNRRGRRAWGAE